MGTTGQPQIPMQQGPITIPSGLPTHIQPHHGPVSLPPGMGIRAPMPNQVTQSGNSKLDDPLSKARQFFNALLTMSKNQSPAMYNTARDLLQQLVVSLVKIVLFSVFNRIF